MIRGKPAVVALAVALAAGLSAASAWAQPEVTWTDVNPDRSTLDAISPSGASGGRVNGLAVDADSKNVYAASEWGGLFKSTDGGRSWQHLDAHLPTATWDVAVDPTDSQRVYATSFFDGRVQSLAGINVSTDGGDTWGHPMSATAPDRLCDHSDRRAEPSAFGIAIDPEAPERVYVGTNCGLAISLDRGETWTWADPTPTLNGSADDVWDVVVHDDGVIDVCGDDGHRRSRDGARSWTPSSTLPGGRCSIAVSPDEPDVLFVAVGTLLFESDDGGESWRQLAGPEPEPQGRIPFVVTNPRDGPGYDLWYGDVHLYRTSCITPELPAAAGPRCDDGAWQDHTRGGHRDVGDLLFDPLAAIDACPTFFSSDGGIYINEVRQAGSCQAPEWQQPAVKTPHALWSFTLAGAPGNPARLYFGTQDNGAFTVSEPGAARGAWENTLCCDVFDISPPPGELSSKVATSICCRRDGVPGRLLLSDPAMLEVREVSDPPPGFLGPGFVPAVAALGDGGVVVTTEGIFITDDYSLSPLTWTQLGAETQPFNPCGIKLALSGGRPTFYLQSGRCFGRSRDQLSRFDGSQADGEWQRIAPFRDNGGISLFDVDPADPERLLAVQLDNLNNPLVMLSEDGGDSWAVLSELMIQITAGNEFRLRNRRGPSYMGFEGYQQPTLVAFDPARRGVLLVGTADAGIFLSTDGGETWQRLSDPNATALSGRPHLPRPRFAYFSERRTAGAYLADDIYIATQGRGVWKMTLKSALQTAPLDACDLMPAICPEPQVDDGTLILDCLRSPSRCIVLDPLRLNCKEKYDCFLPCTNSSACPPFFHLIFEGLDLEVWDVALWTVSVLNDTRIAGSLGILIAAHAHREVHQNSLVHIPR